MTTRRYYAYRVLWAGRWKRSRTRLPLSLLEGREDVEILWDNFEDHEIPEKPQEFGIIMRHADPPPGREDE